MKDVMKKLQATLLMHKLAITRASLFSIVTLGMAWQVSTSGKDLKSFDFWHWIELFIGIIVLWGNQMLSFLDKTMAKISEGKNPFESGNTDFITKPNQDEKKGQ